MPTSQQDSKLPKAVTGRIMALEELQSISVTNPPKLSPDRGLHKLVTARKVLLTLVIASSAVLLFTQSLASGHISTEYVYDDGVYFAASLNVIHGIIPYKDFIFLQPPLITIWLAPFSLLSNISGTRWAFEMARLFTDLVAVLDICLVAFLLRHRSTIRQLFGVGIIAYSEDTLWGSRTILIEPYLVALCLGALIALLDDENITESRLRMSVAGFLYGLAGATKIWAIFPALVALSVIWWIKPGQRSRLVFGIVVAFMAAVLPFALLVPRKFLNEVVFTQALRGADGLGIETRLQDLSGIPDLSYLKYISAPLAIFVLVAIYLLAILLVANSLKSWGLRSGTHLELIAIASAAMIGFSFLVAHSYFNNYGFFAAPFISVSLATISYPFKSKATSSTPLRLRVAAAGTITFIFLTFAWQEFEIAKSSGFALVNQVTSQLSNALGSTGCLWSANPGVPILANRYTGDLTDCPHTVDWGGTELLFVHDYNLAKVQKDAALQKHFLKWLHVSDRLLVNSTDFGTTATIYLKSHFHKVQYHQLDNLPKVIYFRNKPSE